MEIRNADQFLTAESRLVVGVVRTGKSVMTVKRPDVSNAFARRGKSAANQMKIATAPWRSAVEMEAAARAA